jgi:hypothetical protein
MLAAMDTQAEQIERSENIREEVVGKKRWAIAEGFIAGPNPVLDDEELDESASKHETLFLLNAGDQPAKVEISIYFADREPLGPYRYTVQPRRTLQVCLEDIDAPRIPRGKDFASLIESDEAIVVLATRRRTARPDDAPLTKIAFAG